jgi:ATP-binding cassette subfamily B protein
LAPLIPLAFYSKNFAQKVDPLWKKIMERLQKLGNHIQENSLGAEVIRAFNRESYEVNKFAENNENLYYERIDLIREWGKFIPISVFIVAISSALVLVIGAVMERNQFGGVTIGIIVSFNAYVLLVAQPLRLLGFVILLFTQATSSATRVFEIIDTPIDLQSKPDATELERIDGHVRMNNVSFAYSVDAPPILKDISFEAKPDQVVALLGPTGSGKSTLVNLIPRYYDVTEGQITIDGYNVRDVELSSLRRRIGMVLQSSLLFSATVRENIAYGSPDATDEAVIAAAKAANAHEFIEGFPEGYETLIGERGVTLSGGQRQRVAIARALLINPSILILDDSTSSVDTKTEFLIQEALSRLMRGRTTFIIAQRLNSIQNADLILALDKGKIIERGTHAELLEMNGYYAEVYNLQLADQERVRAELEAVGQTPRKYIDEDKRLATDEFRALFDRIGGGSD